MGLKNNRSSDDESLVQAIAQTTDCDNFMESSEREGGQTPPHLNMSGAVVYNDIMLSQPPPAPATFKRPYVIVDARPLLNAKANQAVGKGVESSKVYNASIIYMDIANIHSARKSIDALEEAVADENLW